MNQLSFFPYFPCKDVDQVIEGIHVFSFWKYKDKYVSDPLMLNTLNGICACYVNNNNEHSNNLTVVVINENYGFVPLAEQQMIHLKRFALALLFSNLAKDDELSRCSSENFRLYHQNYEIGQTEVAFTAGSYIGPPTLQSLAETRFVRPSFIPDPQFWTYDERLLLALLNVINSRRPEDDFIFDALEWVKYSYLNSEDYSFASRIVMMTTVFEILFKLEEHNKESDFADKVEQLLCVDTMVVLNPIGQGLPRIKRLNSRGKEKENTIYGWWARDLYSLRSRIVHEGIMRKISYRNHNGFEYLYISLLVLRFCIYRLLEERGHLKYKLATEFPTFSEAEKWLMIRRLRKVEELIDI